MRKEGIADLPLHWGKAPPWLFSRMVKLAKEITKVIIYEYSEEDFLKRLSNPYWFQAFSCVLGYDWNSSGTTTVTCGALKEALNKENLGIAIAGGKGKASRKAPKEIEKFAEALSITDAKIKKLVYSSKMSAKVDNTAVDDGYNLYHHCFIFSKKGSWVTIQQGLNYQNRYARRYHWISDNVKSFVNEPHSAICCDRKEERVLNMVAKKSKESREVSVDLIKDNIGKRLMRQSTLNDLGAKIKKLSMPYHHEIKTLSKQTISTLIKAYEIQPENYEELIAIRGVGPKAVRALALISQLIYGKSPSWEDPVKFSFTHGGKDGTPYPVDRKTYDTSIDILKQAIEEAKINEREKINAIRRLQYYLC